MTPKINPPPAVKPIVLILEPKDEDGHRDLTSRSSQHSIQGIGIHTRDNKRQRADSSNDDNSSTTLKSYLIQDLSNFISSITKSLNEVGQLPVKKRPHAINISQGQSEIRVFDRVYQNPNFYFDKADSSEKKQLFLKPDGSEINGVAMESYIDKVFSDPVIKKAKQHYEKSLQQAKSKNMVVVHSIGNMHDKRKEFEKRYPKIKFEKDEEANVLASPLAIAVGASDPRTGQLANFSSRGPITFSTTILKGIKNGTSFTSPRIAAAYAKLLSQGLTPDQATAYLTRLGTLKQDEYGNKYIYLSFDVVERILKTPIPKDRSRDL
jgi:hypothetical protein